MKTYHLCGLLVALAMLFPGNRLGAKSPFSDGDPVEVSSQAASHPGTPGDSGLWSRIKSGARSIWGGVKSGYAKVVTGLNDALVDQDPPAAVERSAQIPGHDGREFVCQGICYLPDRVVTPAADQLEAGPFPRVLLSYYPEVEHTGEPAQLVVVEGKSGKPLRRFRLFQDSGDPYTGHAGGVAVAGKYVWVASGFTLHGFELQEMLDLLAAPSPRLESDVPGVPRSLQIPAHDLVATRRYTVDSKASFVSFDGTQLWVGDFVKSSNGDFAPVAHHRHTFGKKTWNTWIAGYQVDADGLPTASQEYSFRDGDQTRSAHKPDRLLFCRESVQGMAVCGTSVALSVSYGALNSKLAFYDSPLAKPGTRISFKPSGQGKTFTAEGWLLADGVNHRKTVSLPAGSEDLEFDGRFLYVTFEGASENYRQKWISINPLVAISDRFYLIDPARVLP